MSSSSSASAADRSLQQPGDAAFYLNLPELGVIPSSSADRAIPVRGARNGTPGMPEEAGLALDHDCVELVTWNRKLSLLAEAFRTTLTSLLFSGRNGDRPRLMVADQRQSLRRAKPRYPSTSPSPWPKSTSACF